MMFEELSAGSGYADIVYLPKKDSILPALVIELKWNHSAEGLLRRFETEDIRRLFTDTAKRFLW